MSRRGLSRPLALMIGGAVAAGMASARAQGPAAPSTPAGIATSGPSAEAAPAPAPVFAAVSPEVQVVRFQAPAGVVVEVLGPPPEPIPASDGRGAGTYGLKVGIGYRVRLSNLPDRPGAELFPIVELVGHLHRPAGVDPLRFPIRIIFDELDLDDAVDRGRLVTQVVYLEDPNQALPIGLPKDEIPIETLTPAEEPIKVAMALGRVMAIVRIGGRVPSADEWGQGLGDELGSSSCPFAGPEGGRCGVPCAPARGTPPPAGRAWLPRDEFLCDGGDRAEPMNFAGDGTLQGIDPRDAAIRFSDGRRPRVLPTNVVCIYAPRFAAVRTSIGPNEWVAVDIPRGAEIVEGQVMYAAAQPPRRFILNQPPQVFRHRARPSGLSDRLWVGEVIEVRVLQTLDTLTHPAGAVQVQPPITTSNRQKAMVAKVRARPIVLKTAESVVVTGIIVGPGQEVMAWKPQEIAGVETPPNRPGMAVIKRISTDVADPGDEITISIQYRNMGNTPIGSVSVVDSLLPRLEYVKGSAVGPAGTVFTAAENRAGSTELRWDLPGFVAPGAEGFVTFRAIVR